MYWSSKPEGADFLSILSGADHLSGVGGTNKTVLRVLMKDDVTLMDTHSTDYEGRICLVKTPEDGKKYYMRIFYDGDTVLMCDPTDGELKDQCKVSELECFGIVTGIIRKLEPDAHRPQAEQEEMRSRVLKAMKDPLIGYYQKTWSISAPIAAMERGGAFGCISCGYALGFVDGRRAEQRYRKRQQKAKGGANA